MFYVPLLNCGAAHNYAVLLCKGSLPCPTLFNVTKHKATDMLKYLYYSGRSNGLAYRSRETGITLNLNFAPHENNSFWARFSPATKTSVSFRCLESSTLFTVFPEDDWHFSDIYYSCVTCKKGHVLCLVETWVKDGWKLLSTVIAFLS